MSNTNRRRHLILRALAAFGLTAAAAAVINTYAVPDALPPAVLVRADQPTVDALLVEAPATDADEHLVSVDSVTVETVRDGVTVGWSRRYVAVTGADRYAVRCDTMSAASVPAAVALEMLNDPTDGTCTIEAAR